MAAALDFFGDLTAGERALAAGSGEDERGTQTRERKSTLGKRKRRKSMCSIYHVMQIHCMNIFIYSCMYYPCYIYVYMYMYIHLYDIV